MKAVGQATLSVWSGRHFSLHEVSCQPECALQLREGGRIPEPVVCAMGHSYIEVGERGVWVKDALLTLIRHFVEREGRQLLDELAAPGELRRSFQIFLEEFADYGPGVFVVDFRPMLDREAGQLDFLLRVFDRVGQVLHGFGDFIPSGYLEQHLNAPGLHFTGDVDTGPILDALEGIRGLFD